MGRNSAIAHARAGLVLLILHALSAGAFAQLIDIAKPINDAIGGVAKSSDDALTRVTKENTLASGGGNPRICVADEVELLEFADPFPVNARTPVTREAKNRFSMVLTNFGRVGVQQHEDGMCWAACVQMVLNSHGVKADQDAVAQEFRRNREDKSATYGVLIRALCPELEPQLKNRFAIPFELLPPSSDTLLEELAAGEPVVVGLCEDPKAPAGHMCVVYHASYSVRKLDAMKEILAGAPQKASAVEGPRLGAIPIPRAALVNLSLYDPWFDQGPRGITAAEFKKQVRFIVSRRMAKKMLTDAITPQQSAPQQASHAVDGKDKGKDITIKLPKFKLPKIGK